MMQSLFENLNQAMSASMGLALLAAFVWGVLSIILSPCHLSSIPLIIGFVNGQEKVTAIRAFTLSSLFSLGILITIAALGIITAAAGRMAGDIGPWAYYCVAAIFFIIGLYMMDVITLPWSVPEILSIQRKGKLAALLMGLIFGIALGPCTFAYMAPVLGVAFKVGSTQPVYAGALLLVYASGHCSVIIIAGSAGGWVQQYLNWNEKHGMIVWLRRACGVLVILGGLWLIYSAPV